MAVKKIGDSKKVIRAVRSKKDLKSIPKAVKNPVISSKGVGKILLDVEKEMEKVVVGQKAIVRGILRAVLCGGHVLVEGVPGVAKTLIVKAMARVMGCDMKRIQFTVDLLPTDITGIMSYSPDRGFEMIKGPVFTNFILADEINRAPPKTQSALLEAMQEESVTIARKTYELPKPFFVMATENPLEVSGVYSLPEAQIDRFLFKLLIKYPKIEEESSILSKNTTIRDFEDYGLQPLLSPQIIIDLQRRVKQVFTSDTIRDYIVRIVSETRDKGFELSKYISYGASPRASIALYIASKAEALMSGRNFVTPADVQKVVYPVLRHRIILNYEAEAEGISSDKVIKHILTKVNAP
ncbi:MoxR family ATPase [archaeon]|jgi:MoxR-like ATPase|nr:MoxR family ATPase [archaeon]MBT3577694.1 MoxR family ATPase [archaeon]MBT6820039.1 MoxR family ATPase [archaeon]MBT6955944.1 MoxR family ATPase [archaeon]MBT7025360.1 MoxR family ATPase [archaeon]